MTRDAANSREVEGTDDPDAFLESSKAVAGRITEYAKRYIVPQSQQASELVAQEAQELVGRVEMLLGLVDAAQARVQEGARREIALAASISERVEAAVSAREEAWEERERELKERVAELERQLRGEGDAPREGKERPVLPPASPHAPGAGEPFSPAAPQQREIPPDTSAAYAQPQLSWASPPRRGGNSSRARPQCPMPSPSTGTGSVHGGGVPIPGPMWAEESQEPVWGLPGGTVPGAKGAWDRSAVRLDDLAGSRPEPKRGRSSARVDERMRYRLAAAMAEVQGAARGE